ncbi:hypothetical protein HanPI659440_Chr04g0145761 [Helianthus annuus]|nr:hypothetical protein HanPI659440_Chr04g0145761 [Helianthus annuus]
MGTVKGMVEVSRGTWQPVKPPPTTEEAQHERDRAKSKLDNSMSSMVNGEADKGCSHWWKGGTKSSFQVKVVGPELELAKGNLYQVYLFIWINAILWKCLISFGAP